MRIKVAKVGDSVVNVHAEYEDCAKVARSENVPLAVLDESARVEEIVPHSLVEL